MEKMKLFSLQDAIDWTLGQFHAHPERDWEAAARLAMAGQRRNFPAIRLSMWKRTDDTTIAPPEMQLPEIEIADPAEAALAGKVVELIRPLQLDNPVTLALWPGVGPGTLAASFGANLNAEYGYTPEGEMTLDEALAQPIPDVENSGMLPQIKREIMTWKSLLSPAIKIYMPDTQGPFNIAHAVLGTNVFFAPYDEPEKFRELMSRITDYWLAVQFKVREWIGPERLALIYGETFCIAECSVNLVSPDYYLEFILEHDLRAVRSLGSHYPCHIHPCAGPHVFKVTWENLPGIAITEAGSMEHRMAAGTIQVEDALAMIGDSKTMLHIGQELPEGREFEFIKSNLDLYRTNPRLIFGYTGTHWYKKDRQIIRDLHRRLDDYFAENCR